MHKPPVRKRKKDRVSRAIEELNKTLELMPANKFPPSLWRWGIQRAIEILEEKGK